MLMTFTPFDADAVPDADAAPPMMSDCADVYFLDNIFICFLSFFINIFIFLNTRH